ncbi:hypothetical protein CFBP5877_10890 [Agrobacterium tumefaciens]|uniref:Uncharacterized protein n=1 Tax=Agrobacterium tumefaciens TaxID=358 RepID=A0AAE6BB50_AGRTU|nr:hypothetical protein CFBP5499_11360 [Agrobacterium tumefaciens]QCL79524.1 hypothetical protein CFBP5877_10890 [Agrobacterium tumefaciens]
MGGLVGAGGCGSPPSALPGISPTGGEIDSRQGFAFLDSRDSETRARLANLPPCGEMPGRAEGGKRHTPKRGYFPYRFSSNTIAGLRGRPFPIARLLQTKNPRPKAEDDSWSAHQRQERCLTHPPRAMRAQLPALPSAPLPEPSRRREPRSGARVRG